MILLICYLSESVILIILFGWLGLLLLFLFIIQMYRQQDDLGELNESAVFMQPIRFNAAPVASLLKYNNPQASNLGIYDTIKLSALSAGKSGEVIQFIRLDELSRNTFVTGEAIALLQRYATEDLAFVMVVGNKGAGKSFFCDKILNLSQIKGNHFCRKKNKGINIWSTPYQKDDIKIFLLEIANCDIASEEFKILSTYALLIGSVYIVVDQLNKAERSSILELDSVISDIIDKITPSRLEKGEQARSNHSIFLPKLFYNLSRVQGTKPLQNQSIIRFYPIEYLPDALEKGYKGSSQDLIHVPLLDTKCINEEYIRKVSSIFKDVVAKVEQKRYNELVLSGNIIAKIIKYIEAYLTNKKDIFIDDLYERIIDDLYQSAYNYCILSYHDEMEREFQSEEPKSVEQLLTIFQTISDSVFKKFQEFNLDRNVHQIYEQKLSKHIDDKEKMLMEINLKKTELAVFQTYQPKQIGNIQYYRSTISRINKQRTLNHGKADIVGKINLDFYKQIKSNNNIQYKIMKEIQMLKQNIVKQKGILQAASKVNQQKVNKVSNLNKEQQQYREKYQALQYKVKQLNNRIVEVKKSGDIDPTKQEEERKMLTVSIESNDKIIQQLKGSKQKHKGIVTVQNKLQEIRKKIVIQETLLRQLNDNATNTAVPDKDKNPAQKKKDKAQVKK